MDDNQNGDKNQHSDNEVPQPVQVEEVAANVESPEQIQGSIPPNFPGDNPPVYHDEGNKMYFIGGIVIFFVLVFGAIFWFFLKDRLFPSKPVVTTDTSKKVTLTYWGLWDEKAIFDPVIQAYEKQHPNITINYEKMSPLDYKDRLIARSKTGNGPDIFRFHNTWLPEMQEVVSTLPPEIMSNEEFEKTFYPINQKDLKIADKYYGIPLMVDAIVLIYNNDLLTQAGVVGPPATWVGDNDVLTAVSKTTVRDNSGTIITAGMAIGTASNVDHFGEIFGILLLLNGGDLKKLDQKEAAEALQLYRRFAEENYWNDTMPNSISSFIQGKTAMVFGPTWHIINIKSQNPQLNVKVAPVPKGLDGSQISIANYWVEGVNRFSPNQVEAWKFLKYLSEKDSETKIYEQQTKTRPIGSPYSRKDLGETLKDNALLYPVIQMATANKLVSMPLTDRTEDKGLNDEILGYIENAINQTANGVDYSSALATAKQGIDKVLERYKIQ